MVAVPAPAARLPRAVQHAALQLGPLADVRLSVVAAPVPTVVSLLCDALGGPRQGVAREWTRLVRAAVPATAVLALRPIVERSTVLLPDCLSPVGVGDQAFPTQLERIADTPPEQLLRGVAELFDGVPPPAWQLAMARPRRWLGQYVTALAAAWRAYAPVWRHLTGSRARETGRVGIAAVSGGLDVLLADISPRARFDADTLYLPGRGPRHVPLADRRLLLVPLASGTTASVFSLDAPDRVWIGYPLPGLDRRPAGDLVDAGTAARYDALATVVGPVRAAMLRALRQPMTMGALARRLNARPSTVTYHSEQLASAGLVVRRRGGREVRIERTARGDAVVDLLS